MPEVEATVDIPRPVQKVFAALADPKTQMMYDGEMFMAIEQLTPGPIGRGTRFRGKFKGMGWLECTYDEYEVGSLIQVAVKMPFGAARHRFEFQPTDQGSRLKQRMIVETNLIGAALWPLIVKRMMQKRVRTLNGLVKQYVEADAHTVGD